MIAARAALALYAANEIRGAVLAAPMLWTMYRTGGDDAAPWLVLCSLAGVALSIAAPLVAFRLARRAFHMVGVR